MLFLAGALGIEPSSGVLETLILPMNYAPKLTPRYLYHKDIIKSRKNMELFNFGKLCNDLRILTLK